jgi:hypothetical protein
MRRTVTVSWALARAATARKRAGRTRTSPLAEKVAEWYLDCGLVRAVPVHAQDEAAPVARVHGELDVRDERRSLNRGQLVFSVELPGIEPDALPGNLPAELSVRSVSFRFSTSRYLRFRFRVLTASRAVEVQHPYAQDGYFLTGQLSTNRPRWRRQLRLPRGRKCAGGRLRPRPADRQCVA